MQGGCIPCDVLQAKQRAMIGNVFTVYELYAGEETLGSSTLAWLS